MSDSPSYGQSTSRDHVAVTKSDATVYSPPFRALYIGGTGDVAITSLAGVAATYVGVPAGTILPVAGTKVLSTGTSATSIVAMF